MKVVRELNTFVPQGNLFMALGCFDGVHLAHQQVLSTVLSGKQKGLIPAVFTFDIRDNVKQDTTLLTEAEKLSLFEKIGIELVFLIPFSSVRELSPAFFVQKVLKEQCHTKAISCGYNFHFGKGGIADVTNLQQLCQAQGIDVFILEEQKQDGETISSTRIRRLLQEGKMEQVHQLLGAPYFMEGIVQHGKKIGRQMGIPTINQRIPLGLVRPKNGVYCSETEVDGHRYGSLTNIGTNPTVGGEELSVETWIQDFSGDLYGKMVRLYLLHYLREEQRFPSLERLQSQILKDRIAAKQYYLQYHC